MTDPTNELLGMAKKLNGLYGKARKMKKYTQLLKKVTVGCLKKDGEQGNNTNAAS